MRNSNTRRDGMIDAICTVMDEIVALSERELRAVSSSELREARHLQRELTEAVELRRRLLAQYTSGRAA